MRADIVPRGTFPEYELTDYTMVRRRLSELQGIDPMILVLSRGSFCPKDHQQHLELAAHYPKIAVAYTSGRAPGQVCRAGPAPRIPLQRKRALSAAANCYLTGEWQIPAGPAKMHSYQRRRGPPCAPQPTAEERASDRIPCRKEHAMSEFKAGDRVRNDDNTDDRNGTVLAWDDPRCATAQQDWNGYTAVAWDDDTVTITANAALSRATEINWDEEAEEPEA